MLWDIKNLFEIGLLVGYAVTLMLKLATLENKLKGLIAENRAKLELSIASEAKNMALIQRDMEHLENELRKTLSDILQSQKELLNRP